MIIKHKVSSGIIGMLLLTNGVMGYQYFSDTNELEDKLDNKTAQYDKLSTKHDSLSIRYIDTVSLLEKQQAVIEANNHKIIKYNKVNKKLIKNVKSKDETIKKQKQKVNSLEEKLKQAETRKELPSVSSTGSSQKMNSGQTFEVTAFTAGYESTQKQKGDVGYGLTASGKMVQEGRTIACPKSMEFGTKVNIESIGIRTCEDRGSAITEGHIDVYVSNLAAAKAFGRKSLKVEILGKG